MIWFWTKGLPVTVLLSGFLNGCTPSAPSALPPVKTDSSNTAVTKEMTTEMQEGLSELNESDRVLALKQKLCPVSGEPLGSMGAPLQVQVKNQSVWICCDGCEGRLKKDPDKYLAKLK